MNPLRVLHVSTTIQRGGAENHLFDLVRHQRDAGMQVAVAYLRGECRDLGVPVHDLALRYYGQLKPCWKLRKLIRAFAPTLVHAHMPPAELYCRLALLGVNRRRLPLLITKHNEEPFFRGPGQKLLGRWVARRATAVIAISGAVKRYMSGPTLGIPAERLQTIHYGVNATPFCEAKRESGLALRRQWGIPDDAFLIGFVGRLVPQKSIDTLLRGFALLREHQKSGQTDAWLTIVGVGELESSLRQQARELGIADRVIFAGFYDDMPRVMRAFDAFALTSIYEGFGLVLAEAMATGLPVVATKVGAMPEVVTDGETGFLVAPRSAEQLALALANLHDPVLRAQLGSAGQRRVLREFTLERMFHETDKLYARVSAGAVPDDAKNDSSPPAEETMPCAASSAV